MRSRPLSSLVIAAGGLFGCSLIVSRELPAYRCVVDDPAACPASQACDPATLTCVPLSTPEGGSAPDVADATDEASVDADPQGPTPLGGECVLDDDCAPGLLCGTSTILTTAIVPSSSKPVCTKPCCTSEDCAAGFVCFGPATGGTYCVEASRAARTPPTNRGKTGGESCQLSPECRSGVCLGHCDNDGSKACSKASECPGSTCVGLRCADTCCGSDNCSAGSTCRVMSIATHSVWACGEPNGGNAKNLAELCIENRDCKNDNCVFGVFPKKRCTPNCCSSKDCTALGFGANVCAYGEAGNDRLNWCFEPNPSGSPVGASCAKDADCTTRYCDVELRTCSNVCCTDADCEANEQCRPSPVATPLLRCIPRR